MMSYYLERLNDLYICIYVVYTDISKRGITVKYIVVARVYVCVLEKERDGERSFWPFLFTIHSPQASIYE